MRPIVQVGKGGIDEGLVKAVDQALTDHELVKVKVGESAGLDRHEAADELASQTRSEVAQVLGYTVLLYRADPDDPQIKLPKAKAAGAANVADDDDDDDDDGDDD
jgi:RNA-binding protein